MFLKLYWLGAALALMPLSTQSNEVHRMKLFPYVPEDTNKTAFLINLGVTTLSNMALVKCPYTKYKHKTPNDSFIADDILDSESASRDPTKLFAWVPLLRQSTNQTKITCGTVNIKTGEQSNKEKQWTFNVMWKNGTDNGNFMERQSRTSDISPKHENCDLSAENHTIFGSKREGGFLLMRKYGNIPDLYVNQMFYYFDKLENNERIKEPCGIIKIYGYNPKIKLKTHESTSEAPKISNISKINLDGTNQQNIDVVLDMGGNLNYYQGEKIILKRMRYDVKEEPQVIENSTTSITTNFTINGYEIVELMYNYIGANQNLTISKKYYFGPSEKDLIIKEEIKAYFKNNTSIKPNCSLYYLKVGYLDKVDYNGTKGNYQTLNTTDGIKGKYKIDKTSVIFDEKEDGKTTISCTYKTLDGSITTTTKFINKDRIEMLNKKEPQVPNNTIVSSTSTTTRSNIVEKKAEDVENTAIKRSTIVTGFSMLFILLLLQL